MNLFLAFLVSLVVLVGGTGSDDDNDMDEMRIGSIVILVRLSGVVGAELGMELAKRGHSIHFISYPPMRLGADPRTNSVSCRR